MQGQSTGRRVTMQEAADELGVTVEAIRKRIQRGSMESDKGPDGRRYVYLDESHREVQGEASELVTDLREQVRYLREQLDQEREARTEERRRHDTLMAQLVQRIPELEVPQERSPDTSRGGSGGASWEEAPPAQEGAQEGSEERREPWWRRMFGG